MNIQDRRRNRPSHNQEPEWKAARAARAVGEHPAVFVVTHYDAVLTDLRRRRSKLDAAITALENLGLCGAAKASSNEPFSETVVWRFAHVEITND